jgi:hypothetical protein
MPDRSGWAQSTPLSKKAMPNRSQTVKKKKFIKTFDKARD